MIRKKELRKSENDKFKEFTKTILINFGKKILSRAKPNLVLSNGTFTSLVCLR